MGGYVGSMFGRKGPKTPVKGALPRIKSFLKCHYKGLIGIFLPLIILTSKTLKGNNARTVELMWVWMTWFFWWQPVAVPVTAMIPLFTLPMAGVMTSADTCKCYFNENIGLLVLSGMMILLLNNSGADRRIALWLICSGDNCQFSGKRLVFKCSTAAFFLSMFSNRLIIASAITQYVTPALMEMHSAHAGSKVDPNYQEMRYILNSAVQTASGIGSTAIVHAAFATLVFRGVFVECVPKGTAYEDIFNYLQYSAFAFPVAFIQFLINLGYHMVLINHFAGRQMPAASMTELRKHLLKHKHALPRRVTLHEKFTVFFMISALVLLFCRGNRWFRWATLYETKVDDKILPSITDSTVCAIVVVAMHIIPKGYGWVDYLSADKKSELPPIKPESGILWWKFVDKNLNYGYMIVMGGAIALCKSVRLSKLDGIVAKYTGKTLFTQYPWNTSIFLVCLCSALMSNVMSGVGMVTCMMPIILHMTANITAAGNATNETASGGGRRLLEYVDFGREYYSYEREGSDAANTTAPGPPGKTELWPNRLYLGALAVGLCGSYGFVLPFVYTPAYICRHMGKTPLRKMIKYSSLPTIICVIVLWIALVHWAPIIWDPNDKGYTHIKLPVTAAAGANQSTTPAVSVAATVP